MHFALPPRKTSNPPPYAPRTSRSPFLRRGRLQLLAAVLLGVIFILYVLPRQFSSSSPGRAPLGTPSVVVVTPIDDLNYDQEYIRKIKENRQHYADQHGYQTFFPKVADYDLAGSPLAWSRVPAMRHALTLWPYTTYFFHLDQHALIMTPSLTIEEHIMASEQLDALMLRDKPVVPPDSVIKTFTHLKAQNVDLVLTQDADRLVQNVFVLKQGDWAKFFLDTWFDPLYRSYNFQKAEGHALEHIVQWHPTILAKLALIPQRTMNSYNVDSPGHDTSVLFHDGDFVLSLNGCDNAPQRDCVAELETFYQVWRNVAFKGNA